jgi:hypothetical protein
MTPELIARVDAWLAKRDPQWSRALSRCWKVYGHELRLADSPEEKAAVSAALTGILLALVREAWDDPYASPCICDYDLPSEGWQVYITTAPKIYFEATEAEALVAALEAAPQEAT